MRAQQIALLVSMVVSGFRSLNSGHIFEGVVFRSPHQSWVGDEEDVMMMMTAPFGGPPNMEKQDSTSACAPEDHI